MAQGDDAAVGPGARRARLIALTLVAEFRAVPG